MLFRGFFGFFIIWELGWSGIVQTYSTESINHFHIRQTKFQEFSFRAFLRDFLRCYKYGVRLSSQTDTFFQKPHFSGSTKFGRAAPAEGRPNLASPRPNVRRDKISRSGEPLTLTMGACVNFSGILINRSFGLITLGGGY